MNFSFSFFYSSALDQVPPADLLLLFSTALQSLVGLSRHANITGKVNVIFCSTFYRENLPENRDSTES